MSRFVTPLRLLTRYPFGSMFALLGTTGCHDARIEWPTGDQSTGVIVMLPGVEGGAWQLAETRAGLVKGGVTDDMLALDWGVRPFGSLINLMDLEGNRRRAKILADDIAHRCRNRPGQPIQLIGFSGGGGLALLVAESLPSDVILDQIVLVAAAISPNHDIAPARQHARRGIVNFYSAQDFVVLGWGTRTLGTIDRDRTASAGHVGFKTAAGSLRRQDGLKQVAWTPEWRRLGNDGGHIGWLAREWAAEVLAPVLRQQPDSVASSRPCPTSSPPRR